MITFDKYIKKLLNMSDMEATKILNSLANNVCNRYAGSLIRGSFIWKRTAYGFYLSTTDCDDASVIKIYLNTDSVKVTRLGSDVEDWVEVGQQCHDRIVQAWVADNK
jgi:hypothetical protein